MIGGNWWQQLLLVMAGGALGAGGRFVIGGQLVRNLGTAFPWGTLAVNLIGSFAIGYVAVWLEGRGPAALPLRAFLIVGVLGGLTTFSSLMIESLLLARGHRNDLLVLNLGISLVAGLFLVWLGARLASAAGFGAA